MRSIDPGAGEPASAELVVARDVISVRDLQSTALAATAPHDFRTTDERPVNRPSQRPPAKRGIDAVQLRREVSDQLIVAHRVVIVAARDREAEVDVARFGEVLVAAQMADHADVAPGGRPEEGAAVPAEHLAGGFEEDPPVGNQPRHRNAGVADAIFAAHEVAGDERPVGPRQHVIVQGVHLAERRPHLADFRQQAAGQRGERDEAFFEIDALFAERNEEVGARVGIDHGLKGRLRFVHLERRIGIGEVAARGAQEIADDGNVRIEDLRARCGAAVNRQGATRPARPFSAGWNRRGRLLRGGRRCRARQRSH